MRHLKMRYLFILLLCFQHITFAAEVNVYSARKEALIKPLFDKFTANTGIQVNMISGKADALIKRIEVEKENTPADVLLTVDVGRLIRAKQKNLLMPIKSDPLNARIPAHYRDEDGQWFGLSLRSRIIVYSPERVKADELSSYKDLADKKWEKRICIRSSSNVYNQSLVAAMIANEGIEETEKWAKGLVDNLARPPKGGDRDQIKAVAVGVCDIALVNTYYLAGMLDSKLDSEVHAAKKVKLFWPDQNGHGTHINISGIAILKPSKNINEALKLIEYLISDEAQLWYAKTNYEFPVVSNVKNSSILNDWGTFIADDLNLNLLGEYNTKAILLMDRVGWK